MCGICGFTGQQDIDRLKRMTDLITHRGPDEEGFYADEKICMGSRRLSIIDLSTGKQPVHNENRTIWAVWNGEIYNFLQLRDELIAKGHCFYTHHSDSEVIVHLYEEYGKDFVHRLNGMFAIALWDETENSLLLVRDRIGVKPLFYSIVNNGIVFASEIKCILEYGNDEKNPDYCAMYHYLTFKNIPAPWTAFENISTLLPGERLIYKQGEIKRERYWKIDFSKAAEMPAQEAFEKIHQLLKDAVRIRMVSDVPIGAYLSGGVDSSSVVALMSSLSSTPVKTFCLGYETSFQNKEEDLFYAREVSRRFGTEHHEYMMSSRELTDNIGGVIQSFDQPFSGVISTYFLSKLICRHVKVAVSGDGADELFGSYLAHRLAQPMHYFSSFYPQYENGKLTLQQKKLLAPYQENMELLEELYHFSGGEAARWRYKISLFSDQEKTRLLSKKFLDRAGFASSYELICRHMEQCQARDPLNKMLELDWNTLLPDQVLSFVDFLSMAHSVEVRSPFLDYRLVGYIASLPGGMKIKHGIVKHLLKQTVEKLLPRGITQRKKEGFVLPVFEWMKSELKDYITDILSQDSIKKAGLFDEHYVLELLSAYYAEEGKRYDLAARIWNIAMLQEWWRLYFYD